MNKFLFTATVSGLAVSAVAMAGGPDAMQQTTAMAPVPSGFYAGVEGGVALLSGTGPEGFLYSKLFHPSYNVGAHVGYFFANKLKFEFQYIYINNTETSFSQAQFGIGAVNQSFFLANALYGFDMGCFEPYLGVGIGYAVPTTTLGDTPLNSSFAYQVIGGMEYRFTQQVGLYVDYHFVNETGKLDMFGAATPYNNLINLGLNYYF